MATAAITSAASQLQAAVAALEATPLRRKDADAAALAAVAAIVAANTAMQAAITALENALQSAFSGAFSSAFGGGAVPPAA